MTKQDRAKMVKRATERFGGNHLSQMFTENIVVFCEREVDRAVRAERQRQQELRNVCHDCKVVMIDDGPPLCEDCASKRGHEGMDREDWRTLEAWMKT